jgi:hypothetical protein
LKPLSPTAIDKGFQLEAYVAGSPCVFDIFVTGLRPDTSLQISACSYWRARPSALGLQLTFDHRWTDALGALAAIKARLEDTALSRRVPEKAVSDQRAAPSRRAFTRLTHPTARLLAPLNDDAESITALFGLTIHPRHPWTVTERCVAACHDLAWAHDGRRRACSTVLVSVSAQPWTATRPIGNWSSGFLSTVTTRQRVSILATVKSDMELARGSRWALLSRVERYGRLPQRLWQVAAMASRMTPGSGSVGAVVSNLGEIDAPSFDSAASGWYFVPPSRDQRCLSIGILTLAGKVTAGIRGSGAPTAVIQSATEIFRKAGFDAVLTGYCAEKDDRYE